MCRVLGETASYQGCHTQHSSGGDGVRRRLRVVALSFHCLCLSRGNVKEVFFQTGEVAVIEGRGDGERVPAGKCPDVKEEWVL